MLRRSAVRAVAMLVVAAGLLTGCATTVSMEPAVDANDPLCAEVTVRLPGSVDGQSRRWTDAQATAAWGDPSRVLLTCGVTPPGPSTLRCETVSGVDWIIDESDAPRFRVTTFGRTPAVQLYFDTAVDDGGPGVSSRAVLEQLSPIVSRLPVDGECVAREDAAPVP